MIENGYNEDIEKILRNKSYVSMGFWLSFVSSRIVLSVVQRILSSYFSGGDRKSMKSDE